MTTTAAARERATAPLGATLLVVASAVCFGSVSVLTALATRAGASLPTILAWRYVVAVPMFVVAAGGLRRMRVPADRLTSLTVLGGGGQALVALLALLPLVRFGIPAATLGFLFYTYPAWVALFAALRGTERLTRRRVVALVLSLAGIVCMVGMPWGPSLSRVGLAIALAAAIVYALYIPLINRLQGSLAPAVASAYICGAAGVLYAVGGALLGTLAWTLAPQAWLAIGTMALVCTTLAFIAFLRGLAALGPVRTAIISTVEPFWTAIAGAVALGQPLGPATLAGGALIACAVVVLQTGGAR